MVGRRCSNHTLLPSAAASSIQLLPAKDLSAAAAAPADPFHSPATDELLAVVHVADSMFFPEGVARAVQGLDPDMPYFICGMHCYCLLSRCAAEGTASVQHASAPQAPQRPSMIQRCWHQAPILQKLAGGLQATCCLVTACLCA